MAYNPKHIYKINAKSQQQGRDCFASGSHGVSGTQTINNDFQLSDFVSGVRIEVLGSVNCAYNPKDIYKIMLRASLSESLVMQCSAPPHSNIITSQDKWSCIPQKRFCSGARL